MLKKLRTGRGENSSWSPPEMVEWAAEGASGILSALVNERQRPQISLQSKPKGALESAPEPPEASGGLPNIAIAIPRQLFNGRASGGVEEPIPVRTVPYRICFVVEQGCPFR